MRENFDRTLPWLLVHEGGYVDHPDDPGGATNQGVTYRVYDAWRRRQGLSPQDVRHIDDAEVSAIYRAQYWDKIHGDALPSGVDYAIFDFAVNSGPARAAKFVQRIVGVKEDGVIGAITLEAIERMEPLTLITELCNRRLAWLKTLRHWPTFGRGWTRRVMGEDLGIQARDTGVIDRAADLASDKPVIQPPSVRDDGARVRADDPERNVLAVIKDAVADVPAIGQGVSLTGLAAILPQIDGPLAYAAAAAVVILAVGLVALILRRSRAGTA